MAPTEATMRETTQITSDQEFVIVLKPVSHPELGDIRIDDNLFAIGRTEPPFESYPPEFVADLSRRHARIFSEQGAVYIADLDSKNGTTVNGAKVSQKITRLQDGDEVCFGKTLSYRVRLGARVNTPARVARLVSLTLTPEHAELGVQPIIITKFPFLISKADEAFARYKEEYPHQVNYISRRHAHIFLKGGSPFIEDLGSTNGTFVGGNRLEERAVALDEGDIVAFGGHHFVYKVSLQKEETEIDPTVTKLATSAPAGMPRDMTVSDKTTFVAAADSFLDIFCVDHAQKQDDEVNKEAEKQAEEEKKQAEKRPPRGRYAVFASELAEAFAGNDRPDMKRVARWGGGVLLVAILIGGGLYLTGALTRDLKGLIEDGDYGKAAVIASESLARDPDNSSVKALGTEALLKAHVPGWIGMIKARDFRGASGVLANMKDLGRSNADAQPVLRELEWIGDVEQFMAGRGGIEGPVRLYGDEERIKALLRRWDDDGQSHQVVFNTIANHVPEFRDLYAETVSHLRKLQSDEAVYLAAIDRLKSAIATELGRDQPEALESLLKDYAEKYPRLGGLDTVRRDLRQYIDIENDASARRLGSLANRIARAKFSIPPFQEKYRALSSSDKFPPADVIQQYQAASKAWRTGDANQAFSLLQSINAGPWAEAAAKELEHKKAVATDFAALEKSRNARGYDERLLAFYGSLDPEEDVYYVKAIDADIAQYKDQALGRAKELMSRAQAQWRQYKDGGAIEGSQRIESGVSPQFRTRARALAEAYASAQQGSRIYKQLKTDPPAEWKKSADEISAEMELQRRSLQDLRMVLEPAVLKEKLALIGGSNDGQRKSP